MATLYKRGCPKSEMVRQIQKALHLYPDGIFGILTEEAVRHFRLLYTALQHLRERTIPLMTYGNGIGSRDGQT